LFLQEGTTIVKLHRARINDVIMLLVAGLVLAIDQISKQLILAYFSQPTAPIAIPLIPHIFELTLVHNTGAAFGIFRGDSVLFIFIGIAVVAIALLYARFRNSEGLLLKVCFGLILGGAAGNLLDRVRQGYVTDFFYFHIGHIFSWPVFNVADSGITIGVLLLIVLLWLSPPRQPADRADQQTTVQHEAEPQPSVKHEGR
jgi:signal peptidase II